MKPASRNHKFGFDILFSPQSHIDITLLIDSHTENLKSYDHIYTLMQRIYNPVSSGSISCKGRKDNRSKNEEWSTVKVSATDIEFKP